VKSLDQKIPSFADVYGILIGYADCRPPFTLCSFLIYPIYFLISYFRLFLSLSFFLFSFLSVSFLLVLSFSPFFFLSFVGAPVPCVPGVPASSRTFLLNFYFFTLMYSTTIGCLYTRLLSKT